MDDPELLAAVAKWLGWRRIDGEQYYYWKNAQGEIKTGPNTDPPWLTSVNAALGVLDKRETVKMIWQPVDKVWWVTYEFRFGLSNESLPRAILLVFLESHKEKP